ncbi:transcriptional regulator [Hydrogenispora ethanolica]|jgi:hypothetical protein|uniref:Transcriptional regulator n=1 Tax=Hydrogenispora ethanolica TaxID=1082276 RepID=A0A4R1SAC0_HYDET|nr:DUF2087 domain-containing protein [Hydrogenispora ethanolica]TCL76388.1 transcriptional regulator [Hydrogenispora ethanolica]
MELSKLFWNASLAEMKRGYVADLATEEFVCILCGERFTQGRIYPKGDLWLDAERAVRTHIADEHSSTFAFLLELDKKYTGLTEHQKNLLTCFYQNFSDKEIAAKMENGNTSTIRNQRFSFREKAKQAKVFLAIMELLEERSKAEPFIEIPRGATMVDERFAITEPESRSILETYFKEGPDGPLHSFPKKEKRKVVILKHLVQRFDPKRKYTEKEVNQLLKAAYDDYVTVRRYLIEYGFMDRHADGSLYWVKD